jgi:hypothetical protein
MFRVPHQKHLDSISYGSGIRTHREKTARLRAERLARMEASWVERRKETIANIKSGLVELQIKKVLLKSRRLSKVDE